MEPGDCIVCGTNIHDSGKVRDFYELTHRYFELDDAGLMALVSPETVTTLTFCSSTCLCAYVATKIAPDARTESGDSN